MIAAIAAVLAVVVLGAAAYRQGLSPFGTSRPETPAEPPRFRAAPLPAAAAPEPTAAPAPAKITTQPPGEMTASPPASTQEPAPAPTPRPTKAPAIIWAPPPPGATLTPEQAPTATPKPAPTPAAAPTATPESAPNPIPTPELITAEITTVSFVGTGYTLYLRTGSLPGGRSHEKVTLAVRHADGTVQKKITYLLQMNDGDYTGAVTVDRERVERDDPQWVRQNIEVTVIPEPEEGADKTAPEPTRPKPASTPRPTPTPQPAATQQPTATKRLTVNPQPTATAAPRTTPTPRPTRATVNTAAKRAETITTSLGQQVDVTVTGFDNNPLRFGQLVWSINKGEELLGIPYPSPVVTMKRTRHVSGGFCGHNQMQDAPRYPGDPSVVETSAIEVRVDGKCNDTSGTIAHETAHTWFHGSGSANWIDEGLANAVEQQMAAADGQNETVYPPVTYCKSYRNIRELEKGNPARTVKGTYAGFSCNYSLGDGIFGELREHYGNQEFNNRIAGLAKKHENPAYREPAASDVRRALGDGGQASAIIETWYSGQPEMRKYRHLDMVQWIHPPKTDGEWLHFHGRIHGGGIVHEPAVGKDPFCSQFALYDGTGDTKWVGSINDPISVGWGYHEDTKMITANHRIDPRTGEFQITARILDNAVRGYGNLSLQVSSRVNAGPDGNCQTSVWYSQVPVETGNIPSVFKRTDHVHENAIQWTMTPALNGNTLTFAGTAGQGAINLEYKEGYCSQIRLYRHDERGYDWIASVNPHLPDGRKWQNAEAEITGHQMMSDGSFEATAKVRGGVLPDHGTVLLVVTEKNQMNKANRLCGTPKVLSVAELRK